ncbi:hypothetical protein CMPELA_08500 [Cupriavidus necator]|uniref:Transposase IS66 central domain-containing protein n=2 Tax=Cupriavidus necator TaxID=106590 RepID=A0AAE5ZCD8_CUPNH|nr:hypothetical protein E6A55_08540 [Cupriavidus necator H16]
MRAWACTCQGATLCEWKLASAELLAKLLPPLRNHVQQAPRLHLDDTTLPLLERRRATTRQAHLWGYLVAGLRQENGLWVDHQPAVLFEFAESRAGAHPLNFLRDYHGYLQAAAYSGHDALCRTGRIIEGGCWAHCRRRFFEIAKAQKTPGLAARGHWRGSPSCMPSKPASSTGHRSTSWRCARPRPCRCCRSSISGCRVTPMACWPGIVAQWHAQGPGLTYSAESG